MKKSVIRLLLALLLGLTFGAAGLRGADVAFDLDVIAGVNSAQSLASFGTEDSNREVSSAHAADVLDLRFSARLRVKDALTGQPVNVDSMSVSSCSFKIYRGANLVLGPISMAGSQFSVEDGSARPYIVSYDVDMTRKSTNGQTLVGNAIPSTSTLYIIDHKVPLGGSRPFLTSEINDQYTMLRSIAGTVTVGGVTTPFTFTDVAASVQIVGTPQSVAEVREGSKLKLSYKGVTAGWSLQTTATITDPASWSDVPLGNVTVTSAAGVTTYAIAGVDFEGSPVAVYRLKKSGP